MIEKPGRPPRSEQFEDMTPVQIVKEALAIIEEEPAKLKLGQESLTSLQKKLEFILQSIASLQRERQVLFKDMHKLKN